MPLILSLAKSSKWDLDVVSRLAGSIIAPVLLCLTLISICDSQEPMTRVKIAVLLPKNDSRRFSIHRVMPAIDIAIEKVVNGSVLAPNINLTVKYADSNCHSDAIVEAFNFYIDKDVTVYFGPVCDYAVAPIARVMRYWNIPLLTAGAMAGDFGRHKADTFPLLTRVNAHLNSLANFIITAMGHFSWRRVKIIYDPDAQHEVIERFCHLVADGLHHALLQQQSKNDSIKHDYFKFLKLRDILDALEKEVGNEYSGKIFITFGLENSSNCLSED